MRILPGQRRRLTAPAALMVAMIVAISPTPLLAQDAPRNRPSVQVAAGSHLTEGGDSQAIAVGIPAGRYLTILVSGERSHVPTKVETFENGFSATRYGTVRFVGAELRVSSPRRARVSPYGFVGVGGGQSRPNVNEFFPDPVTHQIGLAFAGGGVRVPIAGRLSAFADARFIFWVGGGSEDLGALVPIRGGLAWTF